MNERLLPPFAVALLGALTLALVSSVLVTLVASSASAASPRNDHATMPRACVARADLIPQEPVLCPLNKTQKDRPTVLLWGDSHAWQMIPALRRAAGGKDVNIVAIVMGGCPPMDNDVAEGRPAPKCFQANDIAIEFTRDLIKSGEGHRVLLAASWQRYREALKVGDQSYTGDMARAMRQGTPRLMRTLARMGAEVDVVGQVATVPDQTAPCKKGNLPYSCDVARNKALADSVGTKRYLTNVMKPLASDASLINVNGYFCGPTTCHGLVGATHTWWDDLHISATMSRKLAGYLRPTTQAADESRPGAVPAVPGGPGCAVPLLC